MSNNTSTAYQHRVFSVLEEFMVLQTNDIIAQFIYGHTLCAADEIPQF